MRLERREVWFTGRVQGVGFRYTVHRLAAGFDVSGYVENLPDGRVHLLVEGLGSESSDFVEAIREKMQANIVDVDEAKSKFTGEFASFDIRR